jgi:hypothetical protein
MGPKSRPKLIHQIYSRSQEEGKAVPDEAVLNMKANFVLPEVEEAFDLVLFTDLPPQVSPHFFS